ncbi:MAG: hypothetical protein D6730_07610 [Bacteroidetes bacterium]|nr:MAG: hypothetical protein D6730_07610 [Bacteroidota bacterium]
MRTTRTLYRRNATQECFYRIDQHTQEVEVVYDFEDGLKKIEHHRFHPHFIQILVSGMEEVDAAMYYRIRDYVACKLGSVPRRHTDELRQYAAN